MTRTHGGVGTAPAAEAPMAATEQLVLLTPCGEPIPSKAALSRDCPPADGWPGGGAPWPWARVGGSVPPSRADLSGTSCGRVYSFLETSPGSHESTLVMRVVGRSELMIPVDNDSMITRVNTRAEALSATSSKRLEMRVHPA